MHCLEGSLLWQEILGYNLLSKKQTYINRSFFLREYCWSPPKRIIPLIKTIIKEQSFRIFPNTLGHERVHFTLEGLFSRFTRAANFSKADPGSKRRKKMKETPFTKAMEKFQGPEEVLLPPLSLSLFFFLSFPFWFSFSYYDLNKTIRVEKAMQSACWTPLTTRHNKYSKYYKFIGKKTNYI